MYTELFNPIYGTVGGLPVIVLGAVSTSTSVGGMTTTTIEWVVTDDDGVIRTVDVSDVVVDVRYRDGKWHDVSPGTVELEADD